MSGKCEIVNPFLADDQCHWVIKVSLHSCSMLRWYKIRCHVFPTMQCSNGIFCTGGHISQNIPKIQVWYDFW